MNIELKITDRTNVEFPIVIKDRVGNEIYRHYENNSFWEKTYDENNNVLTYKNSDGYLAELTYDDKSKQLTYKDSYGHYEIKGKKVLKEEFETFVNNN